MSPVVKYADVEAGTELPPASYPVTRLDLIKYCGASGDFNVIHWNERIARAVGLRRREGPAGVVLVDSHAGLSGSRDAAGGNGSSGSTSSARAGPGHCAGSSW